MQKTLLKTDKEIKTNSNLTKEQSNETNNLNNPKIFIKDLIIGEEYKDQVFAIEEIQKHETKAGKPYYRLKIQDKTGETSAKIWDNAFINCKDLENLLRGDVIKINADFQDFNGEKQIIITKLEKVIEYNLGDLIQVSNKNIDEMWERVKNLINETQDQNIKKLLENIFLNENLQDKIKHCPAAEKVHHDFVGGLLEHVLELIDLALIIIVQYPKANKDFVVSGILLHDIGKIYELQREKTVFIRTQKGYLIGHTILGLELILKNLPQDFPEETKTQLLHIILSHHGELEYGAIVRPATIEAGIVSVVDMVSSKIRQYDKALETSKLDDLGFTEYNKYLQAKIYSNTANTIETEKDKKKV